MAPEKNAKNASRSKSSLDQIFEAGSQDIVWEGFTAPNSLGPFQLLRPLGTGGQGQVYLYQSSAHNQNVAIKFFVAPAEEREKGQPPPNPELVADTRELICREIAALQIGGEGISPKPLWVGEYRGHVYLVMEYVQGENLWSWWQANGNRLSETERIELGRELTRVVAELHKEGVVHADLKLSNFVRQSNGSLRLVDFGMAITRQRSALEKSQRLANLSRPRGTPSHAAPETVLYGIRDLPECDIYALGVILHQIWLGVLPERQAVKNHAEAGQHMLQRNVPQQRRGVGHFPQALVDILDKCLQFNPNNRYSSAKFLHAAIADYLSPRGAAVHEPPTKVLLTPTPMPVPMPMPTQTPPQTRRSSRLAVGAVGLLLFALGSVSGVLLWTLRPRLTGHSEPTSQVGNPAVVASTPPTRSDKPATPPTTGTAPADTHKTDPEPPSTTDSRPPHATDPAPASKPGTAPTHKSGPVASHGTAPARGTPVKPALRHRQPKPESGADDAASDDDQPLYLRQD